MLALTGAGPRGMWRKELALDRRSTLPALALERVSATLLAGRMVRHNDRVCAVVMARLQPRSGRVIWVTLLNQTGHPHDQAIRANAAAAIADLQAETGIPPSSHLPARKEIRAGLWEGAPIVPSAYSSAGRARRMRSRAHVV